MTNSQSERIAKRMARAGLCSRREAEAWILKGRVQVNGILIDSPALNVSPQDTIVVDGKQLPSPDAVRIWLYHKPKGILTTTKDPIKRPTVFDNLPKYLPRVIAVGRLDLNSEGLLLLTNSGELSKHLTLPSSGYKRIYRVRCRGKVSPTVLSSLSKGITVEGMHYAPLKATLDRTQGDNAWLTMILTEGKNREIRKILEHLGHPVSRLIRTAYGPFQLGDLQPWCLKEVNHSYDEVLSKKSPSQEKY